EADIARQLVPGGEGYNSTLLNGVDIVLGGGRAQFLPKGVEGGVRADGRNLINELKDKGYSDVSQRAQLMELPLTGAPPKLVGLFHNSHMSYELQRPATEPSLSDMAVKAVQLLNQNPKGFFLMVEGGRIDHALHDSNAKRALRDTVAFDDAIAAVLAELRKTDPELKNTLVVVTADHDHTLLHQGYAKRTGPTSSTNPGVLGLVRAYNTTASAAEGTPVSDSEGRPYTILSFGNGERRTSGSRASVAALNEESTSSDDYRQEAAVRMPVANETHGGTDVSLKAVGFGADAFHGFLTNTEVFPLLRKASQL
ncbi:MAG: alkaline phosphatase, partial [Myxococcaceae bacterium]